MAFEGEFEVGKIWSKRFNETVIKIHWLENNFGEFLRVYEISPSSSSSDNFICIPNGRAGSLWKRFWEALNHSSKASPSLKPDIIIDPKSFPPVNASTSHQIQVMKEVSDKKDFYNKALAVEVHNSHAGWNRIELGLKKKFNWSNKLDLRCINGRLAFFNASTKQIFDQFREEHNFIIGKNKITVRHWRAEDAFIQKVICSDHDHWIAIRGLPLHLWNGQTFVSICGPWGSFLEVHQDSANFSKLNVCKIKIRAPIKNIPVAVQFKGIWVSIEWIQESSFQSHQYVYHPNIKSIVVIPDNLHVSNIQESSLSILGTNLANTRATISHSPGVTPRNNSSVSATSNSSFSNSSTSNSAIKGLKRFGGECLNCS